VIPASNQKLLVAAVAIDVLGLDHTFRTELRSVRADGGVIAGNLYMVGGGDPVLRTADVPDPLRYPAFNTTALEPLADQVVALGITTIQGDVVGDGSRYDDEFRVPDWGDEIGVPDASPYDALMVNDGILVNGNYGAVPERAAARVLYDLLIARGVTITGSPSSGPTPADPALTTLALIESLPLEDVLVEMLHTSDNNTAELMLKEIGLVAAGQGTRQAGLDAMRATFDRVGAPHRSARAVRRFGTQPHQPRIL
jgi:serine-type D-Ala-D-Ala carboxypeptidase/endopeptidase (penicillin-binding protein 4)